MPSEIRRSAPLLIIILVAGLYAGYAIATFVGPLASSNGYLTERVSASRGGHRAEQSQINGLEQRNSTDQGGASLNAIYSASKDSIVTISGLVSSSPLFGIYSEVLAQASSST